MAGILPTVGTLAHILVGLVVCGLSALFAITSDSTFAAFLLTMMGFSFLVLALIEPHAGGFGRPEREHPVTYWIALLTGFVTFPLGAWQLIRLIG